MRFFPIAFLALTASAHGASYVSESGFLKVPRIDYSVAEVKKACPAHELTVPHDEGKWRVARFAEVANEGGRSYYQLLCRGVDLKKGTPEAAAPMDNVASFLFVSGSDPGRVRLLWAESAEIFGAQWFETAEVKPSADGELLRLPAPTGGNAGYNSDVLFLLAKGDAQRIDFASWKNYVRNQTPKGYRLWDELTPDLGKMTFESSLWREDKDSHATPTGGSVHGTLAVKDGKLAVTSVKFDVKKE